ncbi:DUF1249 domain-containing protein [Methylobacter sp. S3L5C]|uniref:DUF1249 domain-containing protein n=1 Tax=Methylobacter sp. S3L5C TaxID=2839024 RepID=UPI001FADCB84|nr:DUF1249 domain-containing protein [Methylobacter sp. S3L5C]UOA07199.1 DUF1249 domain-containing protein [Methylobacter sp. S3L5C]
MSFVNPVNKSFCLEQICESNYQKLLKLIPDLLNLKETAIGLANHNTTLHITVIENTSYTMTVQLSHCFNKNRDEFMEPALKIRIYLDAQLAEVLSDHTRASVAQIFKDPGLSREIMNYKWRLNYFLQKWLDHCLKKNYQFSKAVDYVALN